MIYLIPQLGAASTAVVAKQCKALTRRVKNCGIKKLPCCVSDAALSFVPTL